MEGTAFALSLEGDRFVAVASSFHRGKAGRRKLHVSAEARNLGTCQPKLGVLNKNIYNTSLGNEPFSRHQLLYANSHPTKMFPFKSIARRS